MIALAKRQVSGFLLSRRDALAEFDVLRLPTMNRIRPVFYGCENSHSGLFSSPSWFLMTLEYRK